LKSGDFNKQMFNSFLDGTKSALEMSAVANGCGLKAPRGGLRFAPCGTHDLPQVLKPRSEGGLLDEKGMVETVSCLEVDGRAVLGDLRWGVYVVIEGMWRVKHRIDDWLTYRAAPGPYQQECFAQYGMKTDKSGRYAAQYKPYHLIGLELGISVASIMCRGEPTGQCKTFAVDTVATAKRDLAAGEKLDGEGGFMAYGKIMPAEDSLAIRGLPIGLAHGLVLKRSVKKDQGLSWDDVEWSLKSQAVAVRREMEDLYREEIASRVNGNSRRNEVDGNHA
jgi:predicted homoserine dehydrogenase-like protein